MSKCQHDLRTYARASTVIRSMTISTWPSARDATSLPSQDISFDSFPVRFPGIYRGSLILSMHHIYIYLIWIIYRSVNYSRLHDWNALECDMRYRIWDVYMYMCIIRIILLTLSSQFFSLFDHLIVKFDFWRIVLVSVYAHGWSNL